MSFDSDTDFAYRQGFKAALAEDRAYQAAEDAAYQQGLDTGYKLGYSAGHTDGLQEAQESERRYSANRFGND